MLLPLLAAASGLTLAAASGCTGTIGGANPGQGGAGNSGQGGQGGGVVDPAVLFAELQPDLLAACGSCHGTSGSISTHLFLADPVYDNVKAWSGIVVKNPTASKFITYASGATTTHSGPELEGDLLAKVTAWLEAEAAFIDEAPPTTPTIPLVGPFDVRTTGTPNIVYFHSYLGATFNGIALTFTASIDGMGGLAVRGLKVIAGSSPRSRSPSPARAPPSARRWPSSRPAQCRRSRGAASRIATAARDRRRRASWTSPPWPRTRPPRAGPCGCAAT
jgi:hypothetical protein